MRPEITTLALVSHCKQLLISCKWKFVNLTILTVKIFSWGEVIKMTNCIEVVLREGKVSLSMQIKFD